MSQDNTSSHNTRVVHPDNDPALRVRQIDADIARLTKQLEYLQRVRQQYAQLLETDQPTIS